MCPTIALEEYTSAVVLASHDHSPIRAVAGEFWLLMSLVGWW